jgi:orotidine 5'-phosphate decarboxylase subfamily 2
MEAPFTERLDQAMVRADSLLCVGLDPHPDRTTGSVLDACRRVIDLTADYAAAFKPNSAFFEASGQNGLADLAAVISHVPDGTMVVLDAKRGDISSTGKAYARAAFEILGADAVTVNPYLGDDAIAPFLEDPTRGAFVLCHTSNPGAASFQQQLVKGWPLYMEVAGRATTWNDNCNVGLVVGATYPDALATVRRITPTLPLLVPGIGAQGGDLKAALAAGLSKTGRGMLVAASRSIFYAEDPGAAARALRDGINEARNDLAEVLE